MGRILKIRAMMIINLTIEWIYFLTVLCQLWLNISNDSLFRSGDPFCNPSQSWRILGFQFVYVY